MKAATVALNVAVSTIAGMTLNFVITKFNEWRTAIETNAQKSKELSSSMTDLISQYKELGDKSGWDTDDFAQAKDLNAEILDLLKNQSAEMDKKLRKLDLENGKYQEQIDLLNELSISTMTQNKADQGKLLEQTAKGKSSGQYVIGDSSDTDMANALGGKFGGSLDSNTGVFNFGWFDPNDADSILAYYDKLSNALDYLGSNYDSATLEASSLYNQLKSEKNAIEDQANAYRSSSDALKEVIAAQKLSSTSSKRSEEDIKAVTDALEGLKGAYGGITSGNLVSFLSGDKKLGGTYADALNQLKEVMLNLGFEDNASDAQAFVDVLVQLGIVSSSSASKVDGLSESASAASDQLKEATDGLDKIQSAYSTLSDVVDEYNENGYLTVSTLTDLINLGPEYYDCLVDESGQLAINTENINTMADAYYEMAKAALYAQAIESLNANTNTYANASKFLAQAQQEVKDMKSLLYAEGQRLIDEGGLSGDALATQVQAQQRIINTYSAMMDLLDKTHAQSAENQFRNPKDKSSNKSSGSEDKMTDAVSAWKTLSTAMEEYNQYGNLCISTLNDLLGLEDDYTSLLTEQNGKMSINTTEFKPIGIQAEAAIEDVREPTPEEYEKLAKKTLTYQKALARYTRKISKINSNKDLTEDEALQQKAEAQAELDGALQESLLEVQETDAQVTIKLEKHWDGVKKVVEEFQSALSDAKAILSSFLSLLSTLNDKSNNDLKLWGDVMGDVIDKRIEALNKQKEALEENNDATERAIELAKAQDELARAEQQRTSRVYTENGYEWQADPEAVRTARQDLNDKQRQWNKEDAEKAIDDQIKKYNEFKDKLSEVMEDIGKSWKDYQKELEYTAQIQKMTITQMEGSLDGYHNKIVASLNTGSAITGIQNLITNLESLINTLTKVNNLYSAIKTGKYEDLGTKGLWNTIKGFFNKGKSENVNKSFKDTFDAAKKAFNAGKKQLTDTATTGTNDVINAMINQIKTSGNGLVETFGGIWEKIKAGAQSLFNGSGEGGGIVSTVVNGFKAVGNAVSKSKIGSTILGGVGKVGTTLVKGGSKLLAGASGLIKTAGTALTAAGPAAIPIAGTAALGIYGGTKAMKNQKKIWSNKEDGFGKKAIKSVASFFWDISPIGAVVNLCKDIFGKSKETAENTKDTANSSSETAENTKNQQSVTNLTINATQVVSKEENKVTDATDARLGMQRCLRMN